MWGTLGVILFLAYSPRGIGELIPRCTACAASWVLCTLPIAVSQEKSESRTFLVVTDGWTAPRVGFTICFCAVWEAHFKAGANFIFLLKVWCLGNFSFPHSSFELHLMLLLQQCPVNAFFHSQLNGVDTSFGHLLLQNSFPLLGQLQREGSYLNLLFPCSPQWGELQQCQRISEQGKIVCTRDPPLITNFCQQCDLQR